MLIFSLRGGVLCCLWGAQQVSRTLITHGSAAAYGTAFAMNAVGLAVGYALAVCARLPVIYRRTIAFEVGTQNLAIPLTARRSDIYAAPRRPHFEDRFCFPVATTV